MSLVNLSLTGNSSVCASVNEAIATTFATKLSYLGGVIGCLYVVIGVVYFGAMYAITLLAKNDNDNKQQMKILQRLMKQQQEKMVSLEKELEKEKQNSQIFYTTLTFSLNAAERKIRLHEKLIGQHTNELYANIDAINRHTDILGNHQETLTNLVRYIHEQNKAINNTHREVENQKALIQGQMDTIDGVVEDLEHLTEEFDRLAEQSDQSFCELEIKLEDAIENFEETKERLTDRLDEQDLLLSSVDFAFERVDELEDRVEDCVAELKDGMKEMGDRVEEVDREVLAVVKITEKMELDLGTLYDDFIGTAGIVEKLVEKTQKIEKDSESEAVVICTGHEHVVTRSVIKNTNQFVLTSHVDKLQLGNLFKLTQLERIDFHGFTYAQEWFMFSKNITSLKEELRRHNYRNLLKFEEFQPLVQHFQKCGTQMLFNWEPINFDA